MQPRIPYQACPLCESTAISEERVSGRTNQTMYKLLPPTIRWMRCSACDHSFTDGYFTDEALAILFVDVLPNQLPGGDTHGPRMVSSRIVELVSGTIDPDTSRWLDVGFGNGALMATAEEYGFEVVGLDLRAASVELMRSFGFKAETTEFTSYTPAQPFEVISMMDVLEHMPFPIPALRHAYDLLSEEGSLLLSMPNADCYAWRRADRLNINPYWGEIEHYHNFGRRRLNALLRQTGFIPVRYGVSERYFMCMEVLARKDVVAKQT